MKNDVELGKKMCLLQEMKQKWKRRFESTTFY
jgi:hypothetical protein